MTVTDVPIKRAESPPRDDVLRMAPFALRQDDEGEAGDGLTLDGFAAVFNRESIIDSWEGKFREKISPGAMKKSFRETRVKVQYDHGRHPLIGSIPVATPLDGYPREETHDVLAPEGGAHVIARLADNWLVEPLRDAISSRAVDGMSFRFSVVREAWFDENGKQIRDEDKLMDLLRRTWFEDVPDDELLLRDLRELKVPELGPVAWPAYDDTSVGVRSKSITIDLGHLDDPEQRKTLARAVLLADAAERTSNDQAPPATDEESAGEHAEQPETDEPPATDTESAGEHPSSEDETPRSTEADEAAAGEHDTTERPPVVPTEWKRSSWYLPAGDELRSSVI